MKCKINLKFLKISLNLNIQMDTNQCKFYNFRVKHPYEHKSDFKKVVKEVRGEDGRVIVQPRNA